MAPEQTFELIPQDSLLDRVRALQADGYRLIQMCATTLPEKKEITYSFDKDTVMFNLRIDVASSGAHVPSVSAIYTCGALYENEMHDLFGITFDGMAFDFKGHLYTTSVKFPFGSTKAPPAPVARPAPAKTPALAANPAPAEAAPAAQTPSA